MAAPKMHLDESSVMCRILCRLLNLLLFACTTFPALAQDKSDPPLIGYIDTAGKVVIKPQFTRANKFSEGLAGVVPANQRLYGVIDISGNMLVAPKFHAIGAFSGGLAPAADIHGTYGFIDRRGDFVISSKYDLARPFSDGVAVVAFASPASAKSESDIYSLVDMAGASIADARYEQINRSSQGLAAVRLNGKWNYVDTKGRLLMKEWVDATVYGFSSGRAPVLKNGLWGYIDTDGSLSISPRFSSITPFENGAAMVAIENDRQIRIIDNVGHFVTDKLFPSMNHFCEGMAFINSDAGVYCIDSRGHTVIATGRLSSVENLPEFHQGLAAVKIKGRYGYVDTTGALVINAEFIQSDGFFSSRARISTQKGGLFEEP